MILKPEDLHLLRVLDTFDGLTARDAAVIGWNHDSLPTTKAATRVLKWMELAGLVRREDERRPITWIRTEAGTKALEAAT